MSARENNLARLQLDQAMDHWSGHWGLVNGVLICVHCGQRQKPSEATLAFVHADQCPQPDLTQHPWLELAALLRALMPETPS
jgi:hypothetical protein